MAQELQTFLRTLPAKNFGVESGTHYFHPKIGQAYVCNEAFDLEDFIDHTSILPGDVLVLDRKSPKCLYYRIN